MLCGVGLLPGLQQNWPGPGRRRAARWSHPPPRSAPSSPETWAAGPRVPILRARPGPEVSGPLLWRSRRRSWAYFLAAMVLLRSRRHYYPLRLNHRLCRPTGSPLCWTDSSYRPCLPVVSCCCCSCYTVRSHRVEREHGSLERLTLVQDCTSLTLRATKRLRPPGGHL